MRSILAKIAGAERWKQEADQAAALRQILAQIVPGSLAPLVECWLDEDDTLVIGCPNGALAARLRQLSPRITHQFRAADVQVKAIRVEVQVNKRAPAPPPPPRRTTPPPVEIAEGLEGLAAGLRAPGLAQAIRTLARHLRERSPGDGPESGEPRRTGCGPPKAQD